MDDRQFMELARELGDIRRMLENVKIREGANMSTWMPVGAAASYASATSFTLAGDFTAYFKIGTKIKLVNSTTKYGYVLSSSYTSPNTTINLVANTSYALAAGAITNVNISYANPPDFPQWLNYTPTITAQSGTITTLGTVAGSFAMVRKTVFFEIFFSITTNGTAAGYLISTLPTTPTGLPMAYGRETAITGKMLQGRGSGSNLNIYFYDNTYAGGDGRNYNLSGFYRMA